MEKKGGGSENRVVHASRGSSVKQSAWQLAVRLDVRIAALK